MKIRICSRCCKLSKSDVQIEAAQVTDRCIGVCGQHRGKYFGYVDGKLAVFENKAEFLDYIKFRLADQV